MRNLTWIFSILVFLLGSRWSLLSSALYLIVNIQVGKHIDFGLFFESLSQIFYFGLLRTVIDGLSPKESTKDQDFRCADDIIE